MQIRSRVPGNQLPDSCGRRFLSRMRSRAFQVIPVSKTRPVGFSFDPRVDTVFITMGSEMKLQF
jgi:hypothetical protein